MKGIFNFRSRLLLPAFLCALIASIAYGSESQARNLYVSPSGDGSDGTTWKKAWKSFLTIDWTQVVTGDQIIVDGGTTSTTYSGAFTIPVSGIVIRQAPGVGHTGQIIINGSGSQPVQTGITFGGSGIHIVGARRSGIKITSFGGECVRIQTDNNTLRNVELGPVTGFPPYGQGRVGALVFGGYNNQFLACDLRDTSTCAYEKPVAGVSNLNIFRNCTFGNTYYGWWAQWGIGIFGARPNGTAVDSQIVAHHCVFGPVLNKGIDVVQGKANVSDSLFLGANQGNVAFEPATGSTAKLVVNKCTLYEPNFSGPSQYPMYMYNITTNGTGTLRVKDSIVYGGVVHVTTGQVVSAGGNVQYHVTGNTTAVAADMVDPQYVAETDLWRPVTSTTISPQVWTTQSYALSATSPALEKGSTITSVTSIVPAYGPAGHLPPLGGP